MECRSIMEQELETIRSELADISYEVGLVAAFVGNHARYGATCLLRDGERCLAMVEHPLILERFLAEQAFLRGAPDSQLSTRS